MRWVGGDDEGGCCGEARLREGVKVDENTPQLQLGLVEAWRTPGCPTGLFGWVSFS